MDGIWWFCILDVLDLGLEGLSTPIFTDVCRGEATDSGKGTLAG
jgi:hypothetical protein